MTELTAANLQKELAALAINSQSTVLARFFKTGPGQYGEGDVFIGVKVPDTRSVCRRYRELPLEEVYQLLDSPIHEHRLAGLVIITERFRRAKTDRLRGELFEFYLDALFRGRINNWDLVDVSAPTFGEYVLKHGKKTLLINLARSEVLWERRMAMMLTFAHIRAGEFDPPQHIATILLGDSHDLIQKAVGWMLREIGNRDLETLRAFLAQHYKAMPRTMLRYAIEKLDAAERAKWMAR